MGGLYGFTGPRDGTLLDRQGAALQHRGGAEQRVELPSGSLALRPRRGPAPGSIAASSLAVSGERALGVVGYLLGLPDDERHASALLAAYVDQGPAFADRLRGAFVIAILDGERLILVRDGAGVRTVYWGRAGRRVVFGIEPKAVWCAPDLPRRVRPAGIAAYLSFSFVPGEHTLLEGVHEVEAGHRVTFMDGDVRRDRWFDFETSEPEGEDPRPAAEVEAEWVERFRDEHRRAVAERRPRGEPVAVFLSGGLDSSVVTAELASQHDAPVSSFALHFGPSYPSELTYARDVATGAGTQHHEVLLVPRDFMPRLRKMVWHLDDPIGDPITAPNFELSRRVSRDVTWIFNGEGGDPVFGGPKNLPMLLHHWYGGIERGPGFRERMYLASFRRGYEELERLLAPAWASQVDARRDLEALVTPYFEAERPRSFLNKLSAANLRMKGAHLILPKVDRMTGAWGLIPLSPLFDERLIRLSFEMPPTLKLKSGIEKVVLKRAYEHALPASVIGRPKSGMRVPVHHWLQGEMQRYARQILSGSELKRAGMFDPARVKQLLAYDTEEGPGRYGLRLWMLITFEIWRRIVVEGEAP